MNLSLALTLLAILVLVGLLVRSKLRADAAEGDGRGHGTAPGQGDRLIDASYISGGAGGGHATTTRVTRDPQKYAKAFVPGKKRKE